MKRYYYTCPIQALYMMKEFGVEFYTQGFLDMESDFLEKELGFHIDIRSIYNALGDRNTLYVKKESEHIFEPKEGDKGIERNLHYAEICYFGGKYWAYENEEKQTTPHQQRVSIVLKDGKQFFMPEVENE